MSFRTEGRNLEAYEIETFEKLPEANHPVIPAKAGI
jgi:hypothetical protein